MSESRGGNAEMPGIDELRTNVLVALADAPHPLVAVTSPRDDTGRLEVAAALAASAELTGRRVALVDADASESRDNLCRSPRLRDRHRTGRLRVECRAVGGRGLSGSADRHRRRP